MIFYTYQCISESFDKSLMKLDSITNITVSFIHLNLKETLLKGLIQLFMYVFGVRDRF
jgi:hypothetical protein